MRALLIAFLLASSATSYAIAKSVPLDETESISCEFFGSGAVEDEYGCFMTLRNPNGIEFDSIEGTHLDGFGDSDVFVVSGYSQDSPIVPSVICRQFPNLDTLVMISGNLRELTPTAFADCGNLRQILLQGNNLTVIPGNVFANSGNLRIVDFGANQISEIDVNAFTGTAIELMELGWNQLTTVNPNWFTSVAATMTFLDLMGNQIHDIGAGGFSPLTSLVQLFLSYNQISTIHGSAFSGLVNLEQLAISSTDITELSPEWFASLTSLRVLQLNNNRITSLPSGVFASLTSLEQLFLQSNRIRDITNDAFGVSTGRLHSVYLMNNLVNNIDPAWLDAAEQLEYLLLSDNLCINRDFFNVAEMRWRIFEELLMCIDNFLLDPWVTCSYTELPGDEYSCSFHSHNPNGRNDFAAIEGDHVTGRTNEDVTIVTATYQNTRIIPSILCETFPNLHTMFLMVSNVEDLMEESFSSCANLQSLHLHNNRINGIPDFTFRNNPNLRVLDVGLNWIETLSENSFTGSALEHIDIDTNRFTEFNQNWFTSVNATLEILDIVGNRISELSEGAFTNLRGLTHLVMGANPITVLPGSAFESLSNLQLLTLDRLMLTSLNPEWFSGLTSLTNLYIQNNFIRELPDGVFNSLTSLERLTFYNNWLLELSGAAFGASLPTLTHLLGQNNRIRSFDPSILDTASNLQWLMLNGNICNGDDFSNVQGNLDFIRDRLTTCFGNFGTEVISCRFSVFAEDGSDYACSMDIHNPIGRNNFESIEGDHLENFTDADVMVMYVFFGVTLNIPTIICDQFPNLIEMDFMSDQIEYLEQNSFSNCRNLRTLMIFDNLISEIPHDLFVNNPNLEFVSFSRNRLTNLAIPSNTFAGTVINFLDLSNNPIGLYNPFWVAPINETIRVLDLLNTQMNWLPFTAFDGLSGLQTLVISNNPISTMSPNIFDPLESLTYLAMGSCQFRNIDPSWYSRLTNLETLMLDNNRILDLPNNAFNSLTNLKTLYVNNNNLRELNVESFGADTLRSIETLFAMYNEITAIDPSFIEAAESLLYLYLTGNECTQQNIWVQETETPWIHEILANCYANFAAESINCNYMMNEDNNYSCMMEIFNPVGRDAWTEISGTHLTGQGNADVVQVAVLMQNTRIVPSVICQQFPNIRELLIYRSQLDFLTSQSFGQCGQLTDLFLFDNTLFEIPDFVFVNNPHLRYLELGLNRLERLSDFSFAGTSIDFLDISNNYLVEYNPRWFAPINSTLRVLDLLSNNIRHIPPDAFRQLRDLRHLVLNNNPIGMLPGNAFEALFELEGLFLSNTSLQIINQDWFRGLGSLQQLQLNHNGIQHLPNNIFSNLRRLRILELADNLIWEISNQQFGDSVETLEIIDLHGNIVNIIDGSWITSASVLNYLLLAGNVCSDEDFDNVSIRVWSILEYLYTCTANFVLEPEVSCHYEDIPGAQYTCTLTAQNARGFDGFTSIPGEHMSGMDDSSVIMVAALNQDMRIFPSVACRQFTNLADIMVYMSNLVEINRATFDACSNLEFLFIDGNLVRQLPDNLLINSPALQYASFAGNRITDISSTAFTGTVINTLDLGFNRISNYNQDAFSVLGETLTFLDIIGNQLRRFPFGAFEGTPNLLELYLDRNPLTELYSGTFAALLNLQRLSMAHCQLGQLNPVLTFNLVNLIHLNLMDNRLDHLPDGMFQNMTSLEELYIHENQIRDLNATHFGGSQGSIRIIRAGTNEINSIDPDILENSSNLQYLLLSGNLCVDNDFLQVQDNIDEVREGLSRCFDNFRLEPSMMCVYEDSEFDYACRLQIHNPQGLSSVFFDTVPGEHVEGRGNDDVVTLTVVDQNTANLPSVLCRTFTNLRSILILRSHMERIGTQTFAGCVNLESLYITDNRLSTVPPNSLSTNSRLNTLGLSSNRINELNPNSFTGTAISFLDLGDNRLNAFSIAWLQPINETLLTLDLIFNNIHGVGSDAFRNLRNIETLALSNNNLHSIAPDAFVSLTNLQVLALGRSHIRELHPDWFASLSTLSRLYLYSNNLRELAGGAFNGLTSLNHLDLDDNGLTRIGVNALGGSMAAINTLVLRNNQIDAFDERILDSATNLNMLYMEGNLCVNENFNEVQNNTAVREAMQGCFENFLSDATMTCNYQMTLLDEYSCDLQIHNPEGLSSGVFNDVPGDHMEGRSDDDVQLVSMIFQNSRILPSVICRTFTNLREILILWSHMDTISGSTFANCRNLEILYLSLNELTTIPPNAFSNSPLLHTLVIGSNRIQELHQNSFRGTAIEFLDLGDNRLTEIDPAWFEPINATLTTLDLVANSFNTIESTTFSNIRNLQAINMNSNSLSSVAPDAFAPLTNLQLLALGNCSLGQVNPDWFVGLSALHRLYLFSNGITDLPGGIFTPLTNLDFLELDNNRLTSFSHEALGDSAASLSVLMLRNNEINSLHPDMLAAMTSLNMLSLQGNVCVDENFSDVRNRVSEVNQQLQACFA